MPLSLAARIIALLPSSLAGAPSRILVLQRPLLGIDAGVDHSHHYAIWATFDRFQVDQ